MPTTGPDTFFTFTDEERIPHDENNTIHTGTNVSLGLCHGLGSGTLNSGTLNSGTLNSGTPQMTTK